MGILYKKTLEMQELNEKMRTEEEQLELYQSTTRTLRNWKHDYQNHIDIKTKNTLNYQNTYVTFILHYPILHSSFLREMLF